MEKAYPGDFLQRCNVMRVQGGSPTLRRLTQINITQHCYDRLPNECCVHLVGRTCFLFQTRRLQLVEWSCIVGNIPYLITSVQEWALTTKMGTEGRPAVCLRDENFSKDGKSVQNLGLRESQGSKNFNINAIVSCYWLIYLKTVLLYLTFNKQRSWLEQQSSKQQAEFSFEKDFNETWLRSISTPVHLTLMEQSNNDMINQPSLCLSYPTKGYFRVIRV